MSLACLVKATCLVALQTCFMLNVLASSNDDKISALPGQPSVEFNQYAGYITVDDVQQRSLFYYFVEAQNSPQTKPLVLWLNGGPGCSSIGGGAFSEHGPFRPKGDALQRNNYSWNIEANIVYLESPAGVGFSFASNQSYYVNDTITAQDNLNFILRWLERYPEYKNRDFFITGESYAGHYVPQLANLVLESELKSTLKGIAIGNPLLDFDIDMNSVGEYFWSHGLISDATHDMLNSRKRRVLSESDVCLFDETSKYLNRKDVQAALHAKLVGVRQWSLCNLGNLNYDHRDELVPTLPLLGILVKFGVRVVVYSGDEDSVIPLIGTRFLVNTLAKDLGLNTTVPYRSWLQNKQVAGWTQVYNNGSLWFATIRSRSRARSSDDTTGEIALIVSKFHPRKGIANSKPIK